jgi:hypothetical protein
MRGSWVGQSVGDIVRPCDGGRVGRYVGMGRREGGKFNTKIKLNFQVQR